jgi:hypothetical protein
VTEVAGAGGIGRWACDIVNGGAGEDRGLERYGRPADEEAFERFRAEAEEAEPEEAPPPAEESRGGIGRLWRRAGDFLRRYAEAGAEAEFQNARNSKWGIAENLELFE